MHAKAARRLRCRLLALRRFQRHIHLEFRPVLRIPVKTTGGLLLQLATIRHGSIAYVAVRLSGNGSPVGVSDDAPAEL